jgi:hypothetical protein
MHLPDGPLASLSGAETLFCVFVQLPRSDIEEIFSRRKDDANTPTK